MPRSLVHSVLSTTGIASSPSLLGFLSSHSLSDEKMHESVYPHSSCPKKRRKNHTSNLIHDAASRLSPAHNTHRRLRAIVPPHLFYIGLPNTPCKKPAAPLAVPVLRQHEKPLWTPTTTHVNTMALQYHLSFDVWFKWFKGLRGGGGGVEIHGHSSHSALAFLLTGGASQSGQSPDFRSSLWWDDGHISGTVETDGYDAWFTRTDGSSSTSIDWCERC